MIQQKVQLPRIVLHAKDVNVENIFIENNPIPESHGSFRYEIYYLINAGTPDEEKRRLLMFSDPVHARQFSRICDSKEFKTTWEQRPGYSCCIQHSDSVQLDMDEKGRTWSISENQPSSPELLLIAKCNEIDNRIKTLARGLRDEIIVKHTMCRLSKKTQQPYVQFKTWSGKNEGTNSYRPLTNYYYVDSKKKKHELDEATVVGRSFGIKIVPMIGIQSITTKESIRGILEQVKVIEPGKDEAKSGIIDIPDDHAVVPTEDEERELKKLKLGIDDDEGSDLPGSLKAKIPNYAEEDSE